VALRNGRFGPAHISVPVGARVTWRFEDREQHNVRIANGPALVFTPSLTAGARRESPFRLPGRYELFCTLHPVTMHEFVDVHAPGAG
jgi:plastocyanin